MNFIAIDFETANANRSSICAVGIAVVKRCKIVKTEHMLIRPVPDYYAHYNTLIHGISDKDTRGLKTFDEQWNRLKKYFCKQVMVAHNASFECSALRAVLDAYNLRYPELEYHCTLRMAQKGLRIQRHSLDRVCRHLNIPLNHHQAQSDAIACAMVAIRLGQRYKANSLRELSGKLGFKPGRIFSASRTHIKYRGK